VRFSAQWLNLATNQTDKALMDGHQMLADYKNQQKVERGFRFLKDPMFLASSMFLKSPKRIMALTMVMTVCLLVYAALEHRMRKTMVDSDASFPNQTGKMVNNPTIRWMFQYFQNIPVIYLQQTKAAVLNINGHHEKLLQLMGKKISQTLFMKLEFEGAECRLKHYKYFITVVEHIHIWTILAPTNMKEFSKHCHRQHNPFSIPILLLNQNSC